MKPKDFINLNGKVVRHDGNTFKIIANTLGNTVLVCADCVSGPLKGKLINLIGNRTKEALTIRNLCGMGLVS